MKKLFIIVFALALLLSACLPAATPALSSASAPSIIPLTASTPLPPALWIGPAVPDALRKQAEGWGIPLANDPAVASLSLDFHFRAATEGSALWTYVLVAPFPTVADGVTSEELRQAWNGSASGPFAGRPLVMDESTLAAFTALWGAPAPGSVRTMPADQLLDAAWAEMPSWGIVPFESLEPRWKVLSVDGQSPIHKDFNPALYPLGVVFSLECAQPCSVSSLPALPASNRDPEKLTTVILTGVTALVRATAYTMERKGVTYPGRDIRDTMREADIAHVSNEIPFYSGCEFPNPRRSKLVFCSSPRYIELLADIGTDVVELTGNHFADYGPKAMEETLAIYKENGIPHYGGGADLADAVKPLLLENHGNKIAFIGCNPVDTGKFPTATDTRPGAAPCDFEYMTQKINELHDEGYVVIATFQYYEYYSPEARPWQQADFRLMADAGASIVSGSQAHFAQIMEFHSGSFIHYGLGNLFFDQMGDVPKIHGIRREFMDRHVIYDGRYISTELLTNMLEDYSRPRPMTPEERAAFLNEYFADSGWVSLSPVPTPAPTLTLTPITLPVPVVTVTSTP